MTIIGIGGMPATGKSYLMQCLMVNLSTRHGHPWVPKAYGTAMYEQLGDKFVMGRYAGVSEFAGTDRMSMNCYRSVKMFWKALAKQVPNAVVLFEGNRLFKDEMLTFATTVADHTAFIMLDASETVLESRHTERRDSQTERILKARKTELDNLLAKRTDVRIIANGTPAEGEDLLCQLLWLATEGD